MISTAMNDELSTASGFNLGVDWLAGVVVLSEVATSKVLPQLYLRGDLI